MAWEACVLSPIRTSPRTSGGEIAEKRPSVSQSSSLLPYSLLLTGPGNGQAGTADPGLRAL